MGMGRDRQYGRFNYVVHIGADNTAGPAAGFQECSDIGMDEPAPIYRDGHEKEESARKITGSKKNTDLTLKRGVINSAGLGDWLNQIRDGGLGAFRTVTIDLQNEQHTAVTRRWKLARARIIKHTSGPLNAKGTDVAIEELVLSFEGLETE
jgi:phage tail-like protein